ncbi:MAG: hypothetical protein JOY79_08760, partial [Acidobacteriaceae bacterium]|nr:hypothetical protein [Acidobacteriaceae bacterium]
MVYRLGVLALLASLLTLGGCRGIVGTAAEANNTPNPQMNGNVQHIIFMIQENRSFDHYFGHLNDYRQAHGLPTDVDGTPAGASNPTPDGTSTVSAFHLITQCTENVSPSWNESHVDINRANPAGPALMDGFVTTAAGFAKANNMNDVQGLRAMGYYDATDLPYYYFMASQFATSDRWFSPAPTRTQPNRLYALAATSAGHVYPPTQAIANSTIFDQLQLHNVTWKVYAVDPKASSVEPFGIYTAHAENIVPYNQYFTDLKNNTLPSVAFIDTGFESGTDEHAPSPIQPGVALVQSFIDALMGSSSWANSIFIVTHDEGGGFYDHVPPVPAVNPDGIAPIDLLPNDIKGDFTITGFRVPLIVVSPF